LVLSKIKKPKVFDVWHGAQRIRIPTGRLVTNSFSLKEKKMKKLTVAVLLVSLVSSNAFAHNWFHQTGNWNDANKWDPCFPDGSNDIQIRYGDSNCILNTNVGASWASTNRLRVSGDANLIIVNGGDLVGVGWMRVGTADGPGRLVQTGGAIRLKNGRDNSKFYVGDANGSQGSTYTISGGTLTYIDGEGSLWLGYRGGEGKLTVVGTSPKIQMRKFSVGGDAGLKAASGTLEFRIGSNGVSPVEISNNIYIDPAGAGSTANLLVSATAAPPAANIVLIRNTGGGSVVGTFDTVQDANGTRAGTEGAPVILSYSGTDYHYRLTYQYTDSKSGATNNVALIYTPKSAPKPESPTAAPAKKPLPPE
jgi:hypothetical protein